MFPAFRYRWSLFAFCGLIALLLVLPVLADWLGHPSREQAYLGMSSEAGPLGVHAREIFHDKTNADILFLGSSLVRADVNLPMVAQGLSSELGRPAHVEALALNWQGLDLQYFLLRDYLETHTAGMVIWNMPVPGSRNLQPHVQAFHFVRFGEYTDALVGLSWRYRLALYGDMVLGTPRELLSRMRANRVTESDMRAEIGPPLGGYYGAKFVGMFQSAPVLPADQAVEAAPWPEVKATGPGLNVYEQHFAEKILELLKQKQIPVAFIHFPIDSERGMSVMPERSNWSQTLGANVPLIGAPSAAVFGGVSDADFLNYYADQHMNKNGNRFYTESILPAILKVYNTEVRHEQ